MGLLTWVNSPGPTACQAAANQPVRLSAPELTDIYFPHSSLSGEDKKKTHLFPALKCNFGFFIIDFKVVNALAVSGFQVLMTITAKGDEGVGKEIEAFHSYQSL